MRFNNYSGGGGYRGLSIGPGAVSPFIKLMLISNLAIFMIQSLADYPLSNILGLTPARFFAEFPNLLFQPFTYMFLHANFWHIFFNMFALWMFGTEIEFTWGKKSFAKFYILAGLSGAILTLIFQPELPFPVIGASGAVYGVLIAYWLLFPNRYLYIYFLFPVKVKWAIPGFMILGFMAGGGDIAHFAHLGGAIFGLIFVKANWRISRFGDVLKNFRHKKQEAKFEKNRLKAEDTMKRVDEILDKISDVGIDNISREDRKFLEDTSSHMSEEKSSDETIQ